MMARSSQARRLPTRLVEKVWGRDTLPAPFAAPEGQRIGEIWFEPPPEVPQVLVKYLFTSEKLSVQVHPSDDTALSGEAGKEECWLVLDAEPDARLAIGFTRAVTPEEIAAAAQDGSIEALLEWHPARPGDLFYLPAGTVHAIGPGLALVEVQQTSETTSSPSQPIATAPSHATPATTASSRPSSPGGWTPCSPPSAGAPGAARAPRRARCRSP